MKSYKNEKGMTVVEILVVFLLTVMLIAVAYLVFSTGFLSYQNTSERVDVQSQFRLTVDILEKEVGNAKNVQLKNVNTDAIPAVTGKWNYIYLKPASDNKNQLYKKNSFGEKAFSTSYPLEDFQVDFQMDPADANAKIMKVYLKAKGLDPYLAVILLQNTNFTSVDTAGYNAIYYEDY